MNSDLAIAQAHEMRPITEIAAKVGLAESDLELFGKYKAKVPLNVVRGLSRDPGHLILVTGTSPTPAGEGKSTVSVGLADALTLRNRNPVLCLREPSLGPVFGIKGGAAGGGHSQVVPMADINLHFTGDFHAITSAHALLSAMLDNYLFRPNTAEIDQRRITWRRAVDMNDRSLRSVTIGLGGATGGIPREDGFIITAASEVMAIFCLASGPQDLQRRLDNIIVGYNRKREPVRAAEVQASGAMTLLLRDALNPNLVQTLGGTPAFVHGGPFANIAHGCNSLIATQAGLALGDVVVTEAGFGADLGAEKFFDIKCRFGGLRPGASVVVTTIRALKMHGGAAKSDLSTENLDALRDGMSNLFGHVENVKKFGVPPTVALNRFTADTPAEVKMVIDACTEKGIRIVEADPWGKGGEGCLDLADAVWDVLEGGEADYTPLYPDDMPLTEKVETVAREIYGAEGVDFAGPALAELGRLQEIMPEAPVCVAKTQYSFSDDPMLLGRPRGFRISVPEVIPSAGAGFIVVKTGAVMTMPGLAAVPAAVGMGVAEDGEMFGLA